MDRDLKYIEHAKQIKRKILVRWVNICKYTNRNWGFRQHVIVRLIEVLVVTCIHYAGVVWINNRSIKEIEQRWYRMIKSAIGAVFNVKLALGEVILGVTPINIQNRVNTVKHLLKLSISNIPEDPLRRHIDQSLQLHKYSSTMSKVKETFQFLRWKLDVDPRSFSDTDTVIVKSNSYAQFNDLSLGACKYSKPQMKKYTENIWQKYLDINYLLEGHSHSPKASCTKLSLTSACTRDIETHTEFILLQQLDELVSTQL